MKRIASIDLVRGLVMIIMALDHTRDFLHVDALTQSPTDLSTTTPILFFTRWITHLCAPAFVFLSGISAYLSKASPANRSFLLKRGCWLILIEFTVVNFGLWMDTRFRTLIFEVIGAIGFGFIMLSLLYKCSPRTLGIIGGILIAGHDLVLILVPMPTSPVPSFLGAFFFGTGVFRLSSGLLLITRYAVLPWLGIMLAGFACGPLFSRPAAARKRILLRIGLTCLALFVLLRFVNIYGDPSRWSVQEQSVYTFLSFMNVSKYPPSLLFTLVTLGIICCILSLAGDKQNKLTLFVTAYGKTPLFYFIIHMYLIHLLMFVVLFWQGFHMHDLVFGPLKLGRPAAASGLTLPWVYLFWMAVVIVMYPLCRWYGRYKAAHPAKKWLRYL